MESSFWQYKADIRRGSLKKDSKEASNDGGTKDIILK